MAIGLMLEKQNPQSLYQNYIQAIQSDVSHYPIFYTEKDALFLSDTSAVNEFTALTDRMYADYNILIKSIPEIKEFAPEREFFEAFMISKSHLTDFAMRDKRSIGFVPIADKLSYSPKGAMTKCYFSEERQGFVLEALCDIAIGQEIHGVFQVRNYFDFFFNYGFLPDPSLMFTFMIADVPPNH